MARAKPPGRSPLESLLDAILGETSLEGALDAGLRQIATHAMAEAGGVLLVDEGRPVLERWHPQDWSPPKLLAEQLRVAARAHLTEGADERTKRPPLGWRVLPLPGEGRILGALVLGPPRRALRRGRELERMARALAIRVAADLEVTRVRSLQTRYERWFKTLDEQLRVLDRERQKFASFVHASGASVFVTDPARVIRWTNAVMSEKPPADGTTWSNRTCREVCSAA